MRDPVAIPGNHPLTLNTPQTHISNTCQMLNVLVLVPVRVRVCVLAFGFAPRMPRLITLLWSHPTSTSTFPSPSSFAFPLSFNLLPSLPSCHLAFVIAILSPLRCLSYDLQCNPCSGAPGAPASICFRPEPEFSI